MTAEEFYIAGNKSYENGYYEEAKVYFQQAIDRNSKWEDLFFGIYLLPEIIFQEGYHITYLYRILILLKYKKGSTPVSEILQKALELDCPALPAHVLNKINANVENLNTCKYLEESYTVAKPFFEHLDYGNYPTASRLHYLLKLLCSAIL